jgi:hypothetical protein
MILHPDSSSTDGYRFFLPSAARPLLSFQQREEVVLKEGSRVRQKHKCIVILFIAAIATTCFDRDWPSSGHNVDVDK